MSFEQFIALFPLKGRVTKEIIKKANILDSWGCIGALTLSSSLGENSVLLNEGTGMRWGNLGGSNDIDDKTIRITTEENVHFMDIKDETDVTFIICTF